MIHLTRQTQKMRLFPLSAKRLKSDQKVVCWAPKVSMQKREKSHVRPLSSQKEEIIHLTRKRRLVPFFCKESASKVIKKWVIEPRWSLWVTFRVKMSLFGHFWERLCRKGTRLSFSRRSQINDSSFWTCSCCPFSTTEVSAVVSCQKKWWKLFVSPTLWWGPPLISVNLR